LFKLKNETKSKIGKEKKKKTSKKEKERKCRN
jgi:hypothetical protein